MKKSAKSSVGLRRSHNEDSFFLYTGVNYAFAIVADGMGGVKAGEVASQMSTNAIRVYLREHLPAANEEIPIILQEAIQRANADVYDYALKKYNYTGMGTTTSVALIMEKKLYIAHVGDSRIYSVSDSAIEQLTVDHSYVNELVMRGQITKEQAKTHPKRNYITRAVGTEETIEVDTLVMDYNHEAILLCSDGLTNLVDDNEIMSIVNVASSFDAATKKLVSLANERGGNDNITVVMLGE